MQKQSYADELENSATPLVQNPIAKRGLPNPYGSAQDPRYTDITQLHSFPSVDAITDETVDEVDNAYDNARPSTETPRFAPDKQIFFLQTAINVDASVDIPFGAQSLRVDNYTNLWFFIPQLRRWIPPDWYGAVYSVTGLKSVSIIWQAPPGLVQPAPTANTVATVIAHLERLVEVAGTKRT